MSEMYEQDESKMTVLFTQCPYEAQVTISGGFDYGHMRKYSSFTIRMFVFYMA